MLNICLTCLKIIVENEKLLDTLTINQVFPFNMRYELMSEKDEDFIFILQIHQSSKNRIRISLHHQENEGKIGILRIDYNSGHTNPQVANEFVPEKFLPFVGKEFENEHHIHYHVQGYKSLAWAIPLSMDSFEIKEINDDDVNFNYTFADIIKSFAKTINIKTNININCLLL